MATNPTRHIYLVVAGDMACTSGTITLMWTNYTPRGEGPTPEQIAKRMRRTNPPDNEVPAVVGWATLLGRGADTAVALLAAHAYTTGVQLDVVVRTRHAPRPGEEGHLSQGAFGHRRGADPLLLGVEYADGRIATNALGRGHPPGPELPDNEPWLSAGAGSGSGRGADMRFFLSPVPPPGSLTIYCAWLSRGITETPTVLDATLLTDATRLVQQLWPPQFDPLDEPILIPPLNLPEGGWFAATLRPDPDSEH